MLMMLLHMKTRYTAPLVFALVGFSQDALRTPSVSSLMEDLRKEPLMAVTHAVEAIPILKEKFAKITAQPSKNYVSPTSAVTQNRPMKVTSKPANDR